MVSICCMNCMNMSLPPQQVRSGLCSSLANVQLRGWFGRIHQFTHIVYIYINIDTRELFVLPLVIFNVVVFEVFTCGLTLFSAMNELGCEQTPDPFRHEYKFTQTYVYMYTQSSYIGYTYTPAAPVLVVHASYMIGDREELAYNTNMNE